MSGKRVLRHWSDDEKISIVEHDLDSGLDLDQFCQAAITGLI